MSRPNPVAVDFETEAIQARPVYPPAPVGVSIREGSESRYYAWGHPTGNNCTYEEGRAALAEVWGRDMVFHNAKFDVDVAVKHMGLEFPSWERIHDTQYLVYLYDVHARRFGLKPSSERILDWPPEEQDLLQDWILRNIPGSTKKNAGAHIAKAPVDLVAPYAEGDTDRTMGLFDYLWPYMEEHSMLVAYDRERRLMPHMLGAEERGVRVDMERLEVDLVTYHEAFQRVDEWLRNRLQSPDINFNSGQQLADALLRTGLATDLPLTASGKPSTAKDALQSAVTDQGVLHALRYRGVLKTCLGSHLGPWAAQASANGGRVHPQWHQTRGDFEKGGTVTGRLSCSNPNLMNPPSDFDGVVVPEGLPPLPLCRSYLVPEPGHVWLKRDYSAQEVRLLGHFEDGPLMRAFQEDVNLDPHQFASDLIREITGNELTRSQTKIIAFSILYGKGVPSLARDLEVAPHEAAMLKETYLGAFPQVRALQRDVKARGRQGLPIRTIGGRLLYSEPPHQGRDWSYKLLNHMIQGSAADVTKEAVCRLCDTMPEEGVFLAQVHDEISISAPAEQADQYMAHMRECMESVECDVTLLSQGYRGENWQDADRHPEV